MYQQTLNFLGESFLSISDPVDHRHWFLTKEQHAFEFIVMNSFYVILTMIGYYLINPTKNNNNNSNSNNNKKSTTNNNNNNNNEEEIDYPSILNKIIAAILIINVILNLIYKCLRGWRVVFFMLQPCHVVSAIYAYCLITSNYQFGRKVFKISVYYIFVTIAALIAPDLEDLTLPFECHNFFIQHYALLVAPFLLQVYRYNISFEISYSLISQGIFGIAHFFVFEICSFISGTNINYMLFPPPLGDLSHLTQESYRIGISVLIFFSSMFVGWLVLIIGKKVRSIVFNSNNNNNNSVKKTK